MVVDSSIPMLSLYRLIPFVYFLLPIAAVAWAVRARQRPRWRNAPRTVAGLFVAGALLGLALSLAWSSALNADVSTGQTVIAAYWMSATLCALAGFSLLTGRILRVVLRACLAPREPFWRHRLGAGLAGVAVALRGAIVSCVGLCVMVATVLSFRPKAVHPGNPATLIHHSFQTVDFRATDGIRLRGWWIAPSADEPAAHDTVLLCHGFGSDKAVALPLARALIGQGYNVLAFDFRAHGESGGQLTTFGDVERRDVLGAIRWIRTEHPSPSGRILGLGVNMGAAALLGAACDPGPDGQSIDAVAAIDLFDQLDSLVDAFARQHESPLAGWFLSNIAVPLAGLQCGVNLNGWSPARDVQELWPRPLLMIHAGYDSLVPLPAGQALFDAALQPKYYYWLENKTPDQMMFADPRAVTVIRAFFKSAKTLI